MRTFKIVEVISNSGSDQRTHHWIIMEKRLWKWSEIETTEGPRTTLIHHKSYNKAEMYLFENYTGHGKCVKDGNIYKYSPYVYYV